MTSPDMTRTVRLYVSDHGFPIVSGVPGHPAWTPVSEPLTVTFRPLPQETVVASQLAALDAREETLRNDLIDNLARINCRRAELRALTHQVTT